MDIFRLNKYYMEIIKVKLIKKTFFSNSVITGTPIVLFENNHENKYYSFEKNPDFNFFFNRLKNNSIKKYVAYTGDDIEENFNIFDVFEFNKEVSIRLSIRDNSFIIIGSLWKNLGKEINKNNRKFYNFLFDCGLGEKNSLGFGFINNNWR